MVISSNTLVANYDYSTTVGCINKSPKESNAVVPATENVYSIMLVESL